MARTKKTKVGQTGDKSPRKHLTTHGRDKIIKDNNINIKKRRMKPGQKALKDIKKYQHSTDLLISKAPMYRLFKEVMDDMVEFQNAASSGDTYSPIKFYQDLRMTKDARECLHEACETYLVALMELANSCAIHAKRVTIMKKDFDLIFRIWRKRTQYDLTNGFKFYLENIRQSKRNELNSFLNE